MLAARIPSRLKQKGVTGKWILRQLLRRHLPTELVDRPKCGFGVPLSAWFRGELSPLLEKMVADGSSPMWQFFDHAAVAGRVSAHLCGGADLHVGLWRALVFYHWSERNLNQ